MAKFFVDTNVFLDQILHRTNDDTANTFFLSCIEQLHNLVTSVSCIQTIIYILEKEKLEREMIRNAILRINELVKQTVTSNLSIAKAMKSDFKDLEDAILYFTAVENQCDAFITRNVKDFPKPHSIPVFTPEEFLARIK